MLIKTEQFRPARGETFWLAWDADDAKLGCSTRGATGWTEAEAVAKLFKLMNMEAIPLPDRSHEQPLSELLGRF